MKLKIFIYIILSAFCLLVNAQNENNYISYYSEKSFEYDVKAGFNIGGASPIPLPEEIREIKGFNPTLALSIEGDVTKWLGEKQNWGITVGLKLENKGMITKARVKNYSTEIVGDGGEKVSGRWTGDVKTKLRNTYFTIPLLASYKFDNRWKLRAGVYFSYLIDGEFSGSVYEGYLREGDPTGPKVEFKDGQTATYDFSNELYKFAYGLEVGASWRAYKNFFLFGDLSWGLNDIFKKDFETVTFNLYPIYVNFGVGYSF